MKDGIVLTGMDHHEIHQATSGLLAYIDAGAGSMLIQAVLAGLLTVGYTIRGKIGMLKVAAARFRHRNESR